jgi:hypothetical protein
MGRKVPFWCSVRLQGRLLLPFSDSLRTEILGSSYTTLRISDFKSSQISSKRLLHDAYKACIKLLRA